MAATKGGDSTQMGMAAIEGGQLPASGSSPEFPIHPGKWAAGDLDGHGAGDGGPPAGPDLEIADQRARNARVRVGTGEGGV